MASIKSITARLLATSGRFSSVAILERFRSNIYQKIYQERLVDVLLKYTKKVTFTEGIRAEIEKMEEGKLLFLKLQKEKI